MNEIEDGDFPASPNKVDQSEAVNGDLPPPDLTAHEARKPTEREAEESQDQLNTSDDIGTPCDLNESRSDVERNEHNASTDAIHSESGTVEEDLDVGGDSPPVIRNSSLHLKEDKEDRTRIAGDRRTQSPEAIKKSMGSLSIVEKGPRKPVEIRPVHIGDMKIRSKLKFEVVTAKVMEEGGKKFVAYTIMMKRASGDPHPAVIHRRYNDFCNLYERILCTFHPSVLGEFQFPKKVLIGNFKAEVISERTDAFHKFLNLIAVNDKLVYSDYFHGFLCSEEQNEAVSHIKLGQYSDAAPLLETIFYVREKLFTLSHLSVLECVIELVACLAAVQADETAYRYALISSQCILLQAGHPYLEKVKVPFLKLAESLAGSVGHDPKPYKKQLSELRYSGVKTDRAPSLLEVIRDKYIHTATKTSRAW